jgi:hypothetical protein
MWERQQCSRLTRSGHHQGMAVAVIADRNDELPDPVAEAFRRVLDHAQPNRIPAAACKPPHRDWNDQLITAIAQLLSQRPWQ